MAGLRSLVKNTALYGLSSMVGRFLNYLLVPLYTTVLPTASGGYEVVTNVCAQTGLIMVLLTLEMEAGFFRFANRSGEDPAEVYISSLISVGGISLIFTVFCLAFLQPVSSFLGYDGHPDFIRVIVVIMAFGSFLCVPSAYLRYKKRPIKFVVIKFVSIIANIVLDPFLLLLCPWSHVRFLASMDQFYNPTYLVGYIFVINLITTCLQFFCLVPEFRGFAYWMDKALLKQVLVYSFPILILGLAGILSQTVDKITYPFLSTDRQEGLVRLDIYGTTTEIAMAVAIFTQAFRYAYELLIFGRKREGDSRRIYTQTMKYFLIFALLTFLTVMFYLDILRYMVVLDYWAGLSVVAIVIDVEIFKGTYFSLSFWYKLTDETHWGTCLSMVGCVIIVRMNALLVPICGFMASAWVSVAGYGVITVLSCWIGQKEHPICYDLKHLGMHVLLTVVFYAAGELVPIQDVVLYLAFRIVLLLVFVAYVTRTDLPLSQIPAINRFIKKRQS